MQSNWKGSTDRSEVRLRREISNFLTAQTEPQRVVVTDMNNTLTSSEFIDTSRLNHLRHVDSDIHASLTQINGLIKGTTAQGTVHSNFEIVQNSQSTTYTSVQAAVQSLQTEIENSHANTTGTLNDYPSLSAENGVHVFSQPISANVHISGDVNDDIPEDFVVTGVSSTGADILNVNHNGDVRVNGEHVATYADESRQTLLADAIHPRTSSLIIGNGGSPHSILMAGTVNTTSDLSVGGGLTAGGHAVLTENNSEISADIALSGTFSEFAVKKTDGSDKLTVSDNDVKIDGNQVVTKTSSGVVSGVNEIDNTNSTFQLKCNSNLALKAFVDGTTKKLSSETHQLFEGSNRVLTTNTGTISAQVKSTGSDTVNLLDDNDGVMFKVVKDSSNVSKAYLNNGSGFDEVGAGTYSTSIASSTTTESTIGGIDAGTSASSLDGTTFSQLFDMLLFPTIFPTRDNASVDFNAFNSLYVIGSTLNHTIATSVNDGAIKLSGNTQSNNWTGNITAATLTVFGTTINLGFSGTDTVDDYTISGYTVQAGTNSVSFNVTFAAGPMPLDSVGNNYSTLQFTGGSRSRTRNFTGVYPLFAQNSSGTDDQQTLVSHTANNIVVVQDYIETDSLKHTLYMPKVMYDLRTTWVIQTFNSVSNTYATGTYPDLWTITNPVTRTINGTSVDYVKFSKTASKGAEATYRFQF